MAFLAENRPLFPEGFSRDFLQRGFQLGASRIPIIGGGQGIFKPQVLDLPLSIFTTPAKLGTPRPYEDEFDHDDRLLYRYQGTNPNHPNNVGLRQVMTSRLPLIYVAGLKPSLYQAYWPAQIVGDTPESLTFRVEIVDSDFAGIAALAGASKDIIMRRYARTEVRRRLHQSIFRTHVIAAYSERCTVCRFAHTDMLDAAHIIPDGDPDGLAAVPNGLALCKLHHAAYDRNLLGITPDYKVKIRKDVMEEEDGPTLKYGLQEFNGLKLAVLPAKTELQPNPDSLAKRFELFQKAQ